MGWRDVYVHTKHTVWFEGCSTRQHRCLSFPPSTHQWQTKDPVTLPRPLHSSCISFEVWHPPPIGRSPDHNTPRYPRSHALTHHLRTERAENNQMPSQSEYEITCTYIYIYSATSIIWTSSSSPKYTNTHAQSAWLITFWGCGNSWSRHLAVVKTYPIDQNW